MSEPLRIGVLGAARITERSLIDPARATGHRLVAVAARDRARAEAFAAGHGVERVAGSYAELVADPEIDVVYNPLANGLHGPWNLAALAAGKHVLSEKPSASNTDEAGEVRQAAQKAGTVFMEAFHYLFHPVTRRLHELLDSGEIGELRHVEAMVAIAAPPDTDPRWSLPLAGGALMDLGCYSLHALRVLAPWAGGAPRLAGARGGERAGAPGVDEWLDADLEFPGGATGSARCHMAYDGLDMSSGSSAPGGRRRPRTSCCPRGTTGSWSAPLRASARNGSGRARRTRTSWRPSPPRCGTCSAAARRGRRGDDDGAHRRLLPRGRVRAEAAYPGLTAPKPCRLAAARLRHTHAYSAGLSTSSTSIRPPSSSARTPASHTAAAA